MRLLMFLARAALGACSTRTTYVERQPPTVVQAPPGSVVVPQGSTVMVKP